MITDKESSYHYFLKLFKVHGPIVKVKYPGQPVLVLISRPEDAEKILKLTQDNPVRNEMEALKMARYINPFYEKKAGIVTENGEEWWRVRSKVQAPVLKPKNVHNYLKDVDQVTLDFLDRISTLRNSEGEVTVDFLEELNKWSLECICLVALNQRVGCFDPNLSPDSEPTLIIKAAIDFMNAFKECESGLKLWKIFPSKIFRQLQDSMQKLTETCETVVQRMESDMQKRAHDPDCQLNLVEQLLQEPGLSHKDVITFMVDLIPGGTNTTSDNAAVLLYLLAKNPRVQTKVQEELDYVLGNGSGNVTAHQLAQLSYTKAVLKECNRLMPPMFGPMRILQEDILLGRYILQKGWSVLLMNACSGWDERQFPRCNEFLPERWLRHRPFGNIHPCASIPFSHGTRMCVGRRIAEQELYTLMARTLHRYNLEWKHGDMERTFMHVFSPKGPLRFTLTERKRKQWSSPQAAIGLRLLSQ
ncbi:probable cytochrome P450 301a1, mitochondrial [Homarus americanus]|uniref:probable cytochrome P450 301a1, mitochondrial n=1 Tax=Homarus americanus TaxID=6706 RepID=UPI001C45ACBB|nr:probable cytochrome P450 301a1, mitochondrial [Homarus americanus]